mmetsp:Transcript_37691/g.72243  ORF Transcript_37691/g.72243 Transcript_37691/m.72243 type:complete len:287 (+) Transcript_37691:129-989(+)
MGSDSDRADEGEIRRSRSIDDDRRRDSRSRSRSPAARRSRSRSRSRSPVRRRSRSPVRRSRSRSRSRSLSPVRRRSRSRSPVRRRSRSRSPRARVPDLGLPSYIARRLEPLFLSGHLTERDLDDRCIDSLRDMKEDLADAVIDKFTEANMARISNKSGFLMGIVRRIEQEPPGTGPTMGDLPRGIRRKLEDLVDDRRIRAGEIEGRALTQLMELPEEMAYEAVDRFCTTDLDTIRSKTGFLMGIIKRVRDDHSRGGGGRYDDRRGGGYGGGYGGDRRDDYDRRGRY